MYLTHGWNCPKAEVEHEVLLEDASDGGRGLQDGGAALECYPLILGGRVCHQPDLVQFVLTIFNTVIFSCGNHSLLRSCNCTPSAGTPEEIG